MIVEGAVAAEAAGFWCGSVGEHHFCDYIVSSPPVLLAAMAERTTTLRLGTAVALGRQQRPRPPGRGLRHARRALGRPGRAGGGPRQPLRAHLRRLRPGPGPLPGDVRRAGGAAGPAAGRDAAQWEGATRPPFRDYTTQPRPLQQPLPVWVGGGSSRDSAEFAAAQGLPLMLPGRARSAPLLRASWSTTTGGAGPSSATTRRVPGRHDRPHVRGADVAAGPPADGAPHARSTWAGCGT